jgi:hypothetical protein
MSAEAPKEAAAPVEKQTNCPACSKPLKKTKRYYRNGKFYCTKRCWINSKKPKEKEGQ